MDGDAHRPSRSALPRTGRAFRHLVSEFARRRNAAGLAAAMGRQGSRPDAPLGRGAGNPPARRRVGVERGGPERECEPDGRVCAADPDRRHDARPAWLRRIYTGHGKTGLSDPSPESILGKQNLRKTIDTFDTLRTYAQSVNVPLILGETNSASGGGEDGTSNTFVSCLWAVDYLFTALEKGVRRAHFHGTFSTSGDGSTSYAPIGADLNPRPLYYGLLCFRKAAPNGICVPVTTDSLVNVRGHATIGIDGKLRVTIVNKDLNLDAVLQIRTKNVYTHAEVQFLTAPSTSSKTEITFCGNSVASDGTWSPGAATTLTSIGNHTSVTVPVANIAIVTFW